MIRCRFYTDAEDWRPVHWPLKYPCWCNGATDYYFIVVAYVDDEKEIVENWPEAYSLESQEVLGHEITGPFLKPYSWLQP